MNAIPTPGNRAPAFLTIGFNSRDGGYSTLAWGLTDDAAHKLIAEFRDRIGEADVESTATEEDLLALGRSHAEHTVTFIRDMS